MKNFLAVSSLFIFVCLIACASSSQKNSEQKNAEMDRFLECQKSSECVLTKNECGGPHALNRKYLKKYDDYIQSTKGQIVCAAGFAPPYWPKGTKAECIKNQCKAVFPK